MDIPIKAVVYPAEEGGYWAEVPAFPGCVTEGDTMEELLSNLREAIQGCVGSRMDAAIAAALAEQPGDVITL